MVTGSARGRAGGGTFFPVFAARLAGPSESGAFTRVRDPSIVVEASPASVVDLPREIAVLTQSFRSACDGPRPLSGVPAGEVGAFLWYAHLAPHRGRRSELASTAASRRGWSFAPVS